MAKESKKPKEQKANKPAKKKSGAKIIAIMILAGTLIPFGAPTLLLALGLLPTLVALVTDTDKNKSAATTIGFMNFVGVVPFIIELWKKGQSWEAAAHIATQPVTWLIMFGSAGIGHLILYTIPPAITFITINKMESRLKTLNEGLEQLEKIWGPDVATQKNIFEIRERENRVKIEEEEQ